MAAANLGLRLLLELSALVALGYWGWAAAYGPAIQVILAVLAPALFATAWGVFISPKAPRRIPDPSRLVAEAALFAIAAVALAAAGAPIPAAAFGGIVAIHLALMVVLGQRGM